MPTRQSLAERAKKKEAAVKSLVEQAEAAQKKEAAAGEEAARSSAVKKDSPASRSENSVLSHVLCHVAASTFVSFVASIRDGARSLSSRFEIGSDLNCDLRRVPLANLRLYEWAVQLRLHVPYMMSCVQLFDRPATRVGMFACLLWALPCLLRAALGCSTCRSTSLTSCRGLELRNAYADSARCDTASNGRCDTSQFKVRSVPA
eukprot:4842504-Amphidinium_carterae.2